MAAHPGSALFALARRRLELLAEGAGRKLGRPGPAEPVGVFGCSCGRAAWRAADCPRRACARK
eukprot:15013342-Alexandrium_andersonii.AAC.1